MQSLLRFYFSYLSNTTLVFLQIAMSLLKYFRNDRNKEPDEVPASSSAHEPFLVKRQKTIQKRRKWNEDYINYGFFHPKGEEENSYSPAQCMFCWTIYGNANVAPSKLVSYFTKQHPERQKKSKEFFQPHLAAQKKQSNLFDKQMGLQAQDKSLLLASLKMLHHVMKIKRPYTELEHVVLPCLEIAEDLIRGDEKDVNKIKQIPLSDITVARRCSVISADIKEQLIQKILQASSFGIQLDENTDITRKLSSLFSVDFRI